MADALDTVARAPFERHQLAALLRPAWDLRGNVCLVDALYIALSDALSAPIVTIDRGLAGSASAVELVEL